MIAVSIVFIIIGILLLIWGIKNPSRNDYGAADFQLYIGAVGSIILGVAILVDALC